MMEPVRVRISHTASASTVVVSGGNGEVDDWDASWLAERLLEVVPKFAYLVVDLRRIEFIETMVIQALVVAKKKMAERGTDLGVLLRENSQPMRVLMQTHLLGFLNVGRPVPDVQCQVLHYRNLFSDQTI